MNVMDGMEYFHLGMRAQGNADGEVYEPEPLPSLVAQLKGVVQVLPGLADLLGRVAYVVEQADGVEVDPETVCQVQGCEAVRLLGVTGSYTLLCGLHQKVADGE